MKKKILLSGLLSFMLLRLASLIDYLLICEMPPHTEGRFVVRAVVREGLYTSKPKTVIREYLEQ
jgi:hypothetical protein